MTQAQAASDSFDIQATDRVELIQADWDTLLKEGRVSPFQTPHWLRPWYAIVAPHIGAQPLFVAVRDAKSGAPLLLLPLCLRRQGMLRVIEFADGTLTDYNAPLLAKAFAPSQSEMNALWRKILAKLPAADVVRLEKMPERFAGGANPLHQLPDNRAMKIDAWSVALPSTRAAYDKLLTSTFLKELRRKGRRVESRGNPALVHARDPKDALRIFNALAEMRTQRFKELDRNNVLADPILRSFYETVIVDSFPQNFTALSALETEGEVVAALFALRHAGSYSLLLSAFRDGEWKSASPGNVILDRMATHLIEAGVGVFDFTIGNESYKRDFGAQSQTLATGDYPLSVLGWPAAMRRTLSHHVGNGLRSPAMTRATSMARRLLRIGS